MPGKATRPNDGRHNNPGGARPGAGRPALTSPEQSKARPVHQLRAHANEWEVIKEFCGLVKRDLPQCQLAVSLLKSNIEAKEMGLI